MKRLLCLSIFFFAAAWTLQPTPPATSQPISPVPIVKVLPAQVKDHGGLHVEGEGVRTITQASAFPVFIKAPPGGEFYLWKYPVGWTVQDNYGDKLTVQDGRKGEYTVSVLVWKVDWDAKKTVKENYAITLVIGDVPVPPEPPGPGPEPPTPPGPAPIDVDGLHVMVFFESGDKAKLSPGQFDIIYGAEMRNWLKANCAADPQTNDRKAYWIVDKDSDLSQLDKKWQDAAKRPRQSIPWLVVSNRSKGGYEGPLPENTKAAIQIMEKYK